MKTLLIPILVAIFFISCKDTSTPRYASASPEIDTVKNLVKDYENGNWESWLSHYADTAKVYHNSKEAVTAMTLKENLSGILANVSSYGFEDEDAFYEMIIDDQGEKWVNFWGNWQGTLAANNKTLSIPVHLTLQFVDGKIVEEHGYYDLSGFMTELNAIKAAEMEEPMEGE